MLPPRVQQRRRSLSVALIASLCVPQSDATRDERAMNAPQPQTSLLTRLQATTTTVLAALSIIEFVDDDDER